MALCVGLGVLLVGCSGDRGAGAAASTPPPPSPPPTATTAATATIAIVTSTAAPSATSTPFALPLAVEAALAQAALDAGVARAAVELVSYRGEEWNDTSLGCPQPGKFYAQVVTPGYVVIVRIGSTEREYHTDLEHRAVTCSGAGNP